MSAATEVEARRPLLCCRLFGTGLLISAAPFWLMFLVALLGSVYSQDSGWSSLQLVAPLVSFLWLSTVSASAYFSLRGRKAGVFFGLVVLWITTYATLPLLPTNWDAGGIIAKIAVAGVFVALLSLGICALLSDAATQGPAENQDQP